MSSFVRIARACASAGRRCVRVPDRYWPVSESRVGHDLCRRALRRRSGRRARRRRGRCRPRSRRRRMASSSCSTTITVLPRSRRWVSVREQALVVALVQADRRLVEDVHHADQAGADLAGQADALRFAAGQRVGAAIERQVVEADVDQELQALADFLEDLVGDLAAPAAAASGRRNSSQRIADRQRGDRRQGCCRRRTRGAPRGAGACRRSPGRAGCRGTWPVPRAPMADSVSR